MTGPPLKRLGAIEISSELPYDTPQLWSGAIYTHPQAVDGIQYVLDLQSREHHSSRACYDPRMSVTEMLRGVAEALAGVDLLVVFGSAARGADRPRSDVDVGVRLRDDSSAARRAVELALGRHLRREVDVVYLGEAPPLLRFQIAREGVLIRQATPHLWSDFRARAMIDWWDWAPTVRMIHDAGLRRLHQQAGRGPA